MEKKIAHLGFIQAIISRMAGNSFFLKGWSVTLVAAIFTLATKDSDKRFLLIAYFPIVMFWCLDTYYFYQENLFREIYQDIADDILSSENFSLDTRSVRNKIKPPYRYFFCHTIFPFHAALALLVILAIFFVFDQ